MITLRLAKRWPARVRGSLRHRPAIAPAYDGADRIEAKKRERETKKEKAATADFTLGDSFDFRFGSTMAAYRSG